LKSQGLLQRAITLFLTLCAVQSDEIRSWDLRVVSAASFFLGGDENTEENVFEIFFHKLSESHGM
jgi:hypothetical protein